MNDDKNNPIIPQIESNPNLTEYCCPFCNRFLFRGDVQRLKMSCPHCQKMIDSDNDGLVKPISETGVFGTTPRKGAFQNHAVFPR